MKAFIVVIWCLAVFVVHRASEPVGIIDFDIDNLENKNIQMLYKCKCVHYDYCDPFGYIDDKKMNTHHFSIARPPHCIGGEFKGEYSCCKSKETNNFRSSVIQNSSKQCGIQSTKTNSEIFTATVNGEFPWIAPIYKKENGLYKFYSTGTLIGPKVIAGVNHHFYGQAAKYKVIVNGNVWMTSVKLRVEGERSVVAIISHPEYSHPKLRNDIALLILDKPLILSNNNMTNTICLPPDDVNLEGETCVVAGWERPNQENSDEFQETLMKKIQLPLVNHQTCQSQLRNTYLGPKFSLHISSICAGGEEGKDACKGNGGSPLMCPVPREPNRFFLAGLVSWGVGCGIANHSGVYTNIRQVKKWILEELLERKLSLT